MPTGCVNNFPKRGAALVTNCDFIEFKKGIAVENCFTGRDPSNFCNIFTSLKTKKNYWITVWRKPHIRRSFFVEITP